jgi:hypothetical protein
VIDNSPMAMKVHAPPIGILRTGTATLSSKDKS